ncbi:MAG: nitroreductase, partial [Clostridiales bacterium]|nr:nitroreductase [Clostridiales bacterium]
LGLNTCWASGTFGKDADAYDIDRGEKLFAVIAVGYGTTNGNPHKSKSFDDVVKGKDLPDWFTAGANAALQAPTAMNRQPFTLSLGKKDKVVLDKASGLDRGILKYNFEVGAAAKGCKKVDWK